MEPLAVFHLAEEGAFSEGLLQIARALDDRLQDNLSTTP